VSFPHLTKRPKKRAGWLVTLGLAGAAYRHSRPVEDARVEVARRLVPLWLLAHGFVAFAAAAMRLGTMPWQVLLGRASMALACAALLAVWGRRGAHRTIEDWRDTGLIGGIVFGFGWAAALALSAGPLTELSGFGMLALGGALLIATTILSAPAPLGGLVFIALAGVGGAAGALFDDTPMLAAMILLCALVAMAALAFGARTLLERIAAQQGLVEKEELVSLLLRDFGDAGADWLWRTDTAKRLVDVAPRLIRQFGLTRSQIENRSLLALLAGESWDQGTVAPGIRDLADRLARRESFRDLVVPVEVGGERRWWSLSATPRRDARGTLLGFWGVGTDVTERHRSVERIDRMARFDALTSLANRAHVIAALGDALREGHCTGGRSTLMLIDLDRFKQVNDTLGHPVGDKLLVAVAGRLRALAGPDDVCGRLGGDEFAVVVPDADDRDRVEALAETIVTSLSAPYEIEGHRLHIGASVGTATAPRDGRVVETMLRNADLALYQAKDQGRGMHRRYEPQLHSAAEHRRRIENALRVALEQGQLRLVYQPIVEAGAGRLAAFEALLRWNHPDLGPIGPEIFLPIAEEARLIGRIGDWVMHTACRDAAAWPDGIGLAVNLAGAQLKDPQLTATVFAALSHSGLDATRLELEIGEDVYLRGGSAMIEATDKLLMLGVRVSLSDYCTSQATTFLRQGRFSSVKIDHDFVRGVAEGSAESIAIVRAIVTLAQNMGMTTVAEGAETQADRDRMLELGCDRIQGWTVGEPLDAGAAATMASSSVARPRDRKTA
jgi:diguanylate cyclase (GGDEF)-like protein/PAS domain S-box-containing protein